MTKLTLPAIGVAALALCLAIPLGAANPTAKTNNKTAKTTAVERTAWAPQTLSGKITIVDPAQKLVVVQTPDGVPFDLDVTAQTRIKNGDKSVALRDLTNDMNQNVSVKLIPERRGDVATSIQIGG